MNQLFLLMPAANDKVAENDMAFIKVLESVDEKTVEGLFAKFHGIIKFFKEEEMGFVYDAKYLKALMNGVNSSDSPNVKQLLTLLNDCDGVSQMSGSEAVVNGMKVSHSLINNYLDCGDRNVNRLVNREALNNPNSPIHLSVDGEEVFLEVMEGNVDEVYNWFVENRFPKYVFDLNYEKHRRTSRVVNGVRVSPLTYSKEQAEEFLKRAVIARRGSRVLYFKDNQNNKIIIFCNEDLEDPSFHGFEVSASDNVEYQKIFKRGGRSLKERLDKIADFYVAGKERV